MVDERWPYLGQCTYYLMSVLGCKGTNFSGRDRIFARLAEILRTTIYFVPLQADKNCSISMRILNYIAQIIASVLYSSLYGIMVFYICLAPLFLLDKISPFWIFVICFFGFDLVIGLQVMAQSIISIPYVWITRENIIAKIISSIIILGAGIIGGIKCWTAVDDMPGLLIFLCVLVTIELTVFVIGTIVMVCKLDEE